MIYLAFSVIVITEDNAYVELVTLTGTSSSFLSGNSSKFNQTNSNAISISYFHQWLTGSNGYSYFPTINYWSS